MTTATFYLFKLYHEAHNFTMKKHYPILYAIRPDLVHIFSYILDMELIFRYNILMLSMNYDGGET